MTELSDDIRRWPDDPFVLFGLDYGASFRDLRRAYARLIRQYKPEHHPEQFRRIREAYEAIEPLLRAREAAEEPGESPPFASPAGPSPSEAAPAGSTAEQASLSTGGESLAEEFTPADAPAEAPSAPAEPAADPLDSWWHLTGTERSSEGYGELRRCVAADPQCEGAYLRLYWMLVIEPELDPQRHRCDWLIEGIQRGASAERLARLYLDEIQRDEQEAITPRSDDFLSTLPRGGGALWPVLNARWRVAGRQQRWDVILRDLDRLRSQVEPSDHRGWVRLVLGAIDHLAWATDPAAVRAVEEFRHELDRQPDAHFTFDSEFARYDLLWELVDGCKKLRSTADAPEGLADLLQASWNEPAERTRTPLLALLRALDAAQGKALVLLDRVHATCPAALHQFGLMVADLYREYNSIPLNRSRPDLEKEVADFIRSAPTLTYPAQRPAIARFCVREMITVETFLQVTLDLAGRQEVSADEIVTHASNDAALHYCCKAMVAFWT